jgi:PAS domain S-box-containing protein
MGVFGDRGARGTNQDFFEIAAPSFAMPNAWQGYASSPSWRIDGLGFGSSFQNLSTDTMRSSSNTLECPPSYLDAVLNAVPLALIGLDWAGTVRYWSQAARELFGWSSADAVGNPLPMLDEPEVRQLLGMISAQRDQTTTWRGPARRADSQIVGVEIEIHPFEAASAEQGVLLVAREAEAFADPLRALIDQLPAFVAYVDRDLRYRIVNHAYEKWLGRPRSEIEGRLVAEFVHADHREQILSMMRQALRGEAVNYAINSPHMSGAEYRFEVNYTPARDETGAVAGLFVLAYDTTERARMEEELRTNNLRWQALLETNPDQVMLFDRDGTIRYINRVHSGLTMEQVLGSRGVDFIVPEQRAQVLAELEHVWTSGERCDFEVQSNTAVPNSWYSCRVSALRQDGTTVGLLAVIRDITNKVRADKALQESERRLRAVFEQTFELVCLLDAEGAILDLNRSHLAFLGITEAEAAGRPLWEAPWWNHTPEVQQRVMQAVRSASRGEPVRFETSLAIGQRPTRVLDVSVKPVRGEQGDIVFLLAEARDVTEQRRAESALADRDQLLRSVGDNLPNLMIYQVLLNKDGSRQFTYLSAGVERLTGVGREAALRDPSLLYGLIHEDDRMQVALAEEESSRNLTPFDAVVRMRVPGGGVRWSHLRSAPRLLPDGGILYDGVELDITELKRAEEERAAFQQHLLELRKNESIGVLAGGIAHDFNNYLTGIVGSASLARMDLSEGSDLHHSLEQVEAIAMRAAELCKQMLAYAGKGRMVTQSVQINELLVALQPRLQSGISAETRLVFRFAEQLPALEIDPAQIRQVVVNLVANAAESLPEGRGEVVVSTDFFRLDAAYRSRHRLETESAERTYACVRIRYTGHGIAPELLPRIFEPFYTTKFLGRGLGLAAVLGIVRSHRGLVTVDSAPGKGTVVDVLLPCGESPLPTAKEKSVPAPLTWKGHGTILIVEDEAMVRTATARMLEVMGFQVVQAVDGRDGLIKFQAYPDGFRLVLLDLAMPLLSGEEMLARLKQLRPALPVVIMSGYDQQQVAQQLPPGQVAAYLEKPFRMDALMATLQQVLA